MDKLYERLEHRLHVKKMDMRRKTAPPMVTSLVSETGCKCCKAILNCESDKVCGRVVPLASTTLNFFSNDLVRDSTLVFTFDDSVGGIYNLSLKGIMPVFFDQFDWKSLLTGPGSPSSLRFNNLDSPVNVL